MLSKIFQEGKIEKEQRKKFLPFVNQRNFMGCLLSENTKVQYLSRDQTNKKNMAMIQNLKKSTNQHDFDVQYQKMLQKLKRMEKATKTQEYDYDKQIDRCIQSLKSCPIQSHRHQDQIFYMDIKQALNDKIGLIKEDIISRIKNKKHRCCTRMNSSSCQKKFKQKKTNKSFCAKQNKPPKSLLINRDIFGSVSQKSQYMADFTQTGLNYRALVKSQKSNPWKKWYERQKIQVFPGYKVTVKKLQKSIY